MFIYCRQFCALHAVMLLIFFSSVSVAFAQNEEQLEERAQAIQQAQANEQNALKDIDAYPLHAGGLEVWPKLKVATQFISNIFAEEDGGEDDFVTSVEPTLNIKKRYRDHEFNFNTSGAAFRYASNDSENIENFGTSFFGHLTATRRLRLPFAVSYLVDHKQRNIERTLVNSEEPIKFKTFKGEVGLEYNPNRFFWNNYVRHEQRRFDNGTTGSGAVLVREDGDFDSLEFETRVGYETGAQWSPFLGLTLGTNDYLRRGFIGTAFDGSSRDNDYVTVLAGVGFNYKGLITGEFGVGQTHVSYDDSSVDDIDALAIKGNASWQVRERMVLDFELGRRIEEDNLLNTGIVETEGSIGLNYELDRDLFMNSFVRVQNDDFDVSGREDTTYTGKVGLYYIINPRFQVEAGYTYRNRDSNVDDASYDQNIFMLSLTGSL